MKVLKIIGLLFFGLFLIVFFNDPEYALSSLFGPYSSGIILAVFMFAYVFINKQFEGKIAILLTIGVFFVLIYLFFVY